MKKMASVNVVPFFHHYVLGVGDRPYGRESNHLKQQHWALKKIVSSGTVAKELECKNCLSG